MVNTEKPHNLITIILQYATTGSMLIWQLSPRNNFDSINVA